MLRWAFFAVIFLFVNRCFCSCFFGLLQFTPPSANISHSKPTSFTRKPGVLLNLQNVSRESQEFAQSQKRLNSWDLYYKYQNHPILFQQHQCGATLIRCLVSVYYELHLRHGFDTRCQSTTWSYPLSYILTVWTPPPQVGPSTIRCVRMLSE